MRTRSPGGLASALAALAILVPSAARPQVRIGPLTEVRKLRFEGASSLPEHRLRGVMKTKDRGPAYAVRSALGKLPLVPGPKPHPFSPIELQQDVVRMRLLYRASGFPRAQVRYEVARDEKHDLLDVTLVIDEGPPLILTDVRITGPDSLSPLPVAEGDRTSWARLEKSVLSQQGRRMDVAEAIDGRKRLSDWWRDRGYPGASVAALFGADSARFVGQLDYRVTPGPFARFGEVRVTGNETISAATLRQQASIDVGAPYSATELEKAREGVQSLDIVRTVSLEVQPAGSADTTRTAGDSTVAVSPGGELPVLIRISEGDRRLVSGELGYVTDAGLSSEARWTNRNFFGGGRVLTLTGLAQTGWLSLETNPDIRYRGALSLKQPALLDRRGSTVVSPFIDKRDDTQDRSVQYGLNTTFVHQLRHLQSISLDYQIARRHVYEYRFGDLASGEIDLLTFLTQAAQGLLTSGGANLNLSTFTLSGSLGRLDNPANPRHGLTIRPAIQVTAPTSLSSTAYWRLDARANGYLPLGRKSVLTVRLGLGHLYPFGKSIPGPGDDPATKALQLRDASFTTGGTGEVRGWEDRLLGPKVPNILYTQVGDSLVPRAEGYVPVGGFGRALFSLDLRLPFPWLGPNFGSRLYLDGGRVWSNDARFGLEGDPNGQEKVFVAAGTGIDLRTPVGPVETSIAYKLNPSITDLVDASDMLLAVQEGRPIESLRRRNGRRWQFHLAIGTSF